jgi:hypothetical protein
MNIGALHTQLITQAANGKVILNTTLLAQNTVNGLQTDFGLVQGDFLTISGITATDIPEPFGDSITITAGTTGVFQLNGLSFNLVFTINAEVVDLCLQIQMPDRWKVKDSFPELTLFPFSLIELSKGLFIFDSKGKSSFTPAFYSYGSIPQLAEGLSLIASLDLSSIPVLKDMLDNKLPTGSLTISGPFSAATRFPYPVMQLTTAISNSPVTIIPGITFDSLSLSVSISDPGSSYIQDFIFSLDAPAGDMDYTVTLSDSADIISLAVTPKPSASFNLQTLSESDLVKSILPPGINFGSFVPDPLMSVFSSIEFKGAGFSFSLSNKQITEVDFSIGQAKDQSLQLGLFTFTNIVMRANWESPGSESAMVFVLFSAEANIHLKVFSDPFHFSISVSEIQSKWQIDLIEAQYFGAISLAGIIREIAPGTTIPTVLNDLQFGKFYVRAEPGGNSYTCSCQGAFGTEIMDTVFSSNCNLILTVSGQGTDFKLSGGFAVGNDYWFNIVTGLAKNSTSTTFTFTGTSTAIPISDLIINLFADFDIDLSVLPEIMLSNATINYNIPTDGLVSIDADFVFDTDYTGEFHFAAQKAGSPASWQFVAFAGIGTQNPVDIGAMLPLVGKEISGDFELKESYLLITSKTPAGITIPSKPDLTITAGVSFGFDMVLAGQAQKVMLPVVSYSNPDATQDQENTASAAPGSNPALLPATGGTDGSQSNTANNSIYTIQLQKKLGPIFVDSIGINYVGKVLACSINASMNIGPLNVSLDNFSFGSSISEFHPVFDLGGLGIAYSTTGLTIEGAIIRVPDKQLAQGVTLQFDGSLVVQAEQFGLSALASYAQMSDGLPSMFIFVGVNAILGGPPFFVVTGLMGGFGYNRSLTIPSFEQVQSFPLLAIGGPTSGSTKDQAMDTLQILEGQKAGADGTKTKWIAPSEGEYWLAAGVKFTSFEIVQGELLLVAEFGKDLQFALLGLAWLSLPKDASISNSFVYVELQMAAVLKPSDGYFYAAASLTANSFVLTQSCHLTGGFAFSLWFGSNPYAGQFVMTVGGYHPAFTVPSYYPNVARLGFNWQVSSDVSIKGNCYFAVTPSCGMAGGGLEVLFQSGDIKAWFTAQADMLVTWHPFSFVADISIEIGASVRLNLLVCHTTVSVSIGASLSLWGPPLGGTVRVHIVIVTISISFGSDSAKDRDREILDWTGFKQLLPAPTEVCKIEPGSGLTQILDRDTVTQTIIFSSQPQSGNPATKIWVVRGGGFSFTTQSAIPASMLTYGNDNAYGKNLTGSNISIRPMNHTDIISDHNIRISKDVAGNSPIDVTTWNFSKNTGNVASTLWGEPLKDSNGFVQGLSIPSADTISGQLMGFTVTVPDPVPGSTFGIVPMAALMVEYILSGKAKNPLGTGVVASTDYIPAPSDTTKNDIGSIATSAWTNRSAIYSILSGNNIYSGKNDMMKGMAADSENLFIDTPMEQSN